MGEFFKVWADRYALHVEIKRGTVTIRPSKIVVTSNWSIEECWSEPQVLEPLLRRFHQHEFTEQIDCSLMPKPLKKQRVADCILEARKQAELEDAIHEQRRNQAKERDIRFLLGESQSDFAPANSQSSFSNTQLSMSAVLTCEHNMPIRYACEACARKHD